MNDKEIAEIRRLFKPDKTNIHHIRGCFVNEKHEIVSEFDQSLSLLPEDETEKFLSTLKKTLSGAVFKNLLNIEFDTQQVVDSDEHRLLMKLRDSRLQDEEALHTLFQIIIDAVHIEGNYLILIASDVYDIPYRAKDGGSLPDASEDLFSYILCGISPIKQPKPALRYLAGENAFSNVVSDWLVGAPELGFLFPAFDDRRTNLYAALCYTKNIADSQEAFIDALFRQEAPMPAAVQKEIFSEILAESLDEDCSLSVVQAVHGQIQEMIDIHKENKEEEPLTVSKGMMQQILRESDVEEARIEVFSEAYDEQFGAQRNLSAKNIVDLKQLELVTPDVKIHISAERPDLVETRIVDGVRYIMIRAEEGVELNGVAVQISAQLPAAETPPSEDG